MKRLLAVLLVLSTSLASNAAVRVRVKKSDGVEAILSAQKVDGTSRSLNKRIIRQIPFYMDASSELAKIQYVEYEVADDAVTPEITHALARSKSRALRANSEVRAIISQGPTKNRINLTILGDGYTSKEKDKFFEDAKRTTDGLFKGKTFATYLPLFNVTAVFVESQESGIGDGAAKNTAFRLYRTPKGSKRAIMPGNETALEQAIDLAPATDYPIVLANDDYYGGLGGRYAISTSSEVSGLVVLRHELGHNFGQVGEEYDNGYVYSGANASSSSNVPWKHWIDGPLEVHEAKLLSGDYVWQNLSTGPYEKSFSIPKGNGLLFFDISSVGWSTANDVKMTLNGSVLPAIGKFHSDRSFYSTDPEAVKEASSYKLRIEEQIKDKDNVLGFAIAYTSPTNYNFTKDKVGAFASYDDFGRKTYRPTHDSCLMRNMEIENFCVVDIENMWIKFLNRVRLIDQIEVTPDGTQFEVVLRAQNLEGLSVRWYSVVNNQETELVDLQDALKWQSGTLKGKIRAKVDFKTPEVRKYNSRFQDQQDAIL